MSKYEDVDDWHLTPKGWVAGSTQRDGQFKSVEPPVDRVLTISISDGFSLRGASQPSVTETWDIVTALRRRWGHTPGDKPARRKAVRTSL
jgi:hypothetical protein